MFQSPVAAEVDTIKTVGQLITIFKRMRQAADIDVRKHADELASPRTKDGVTSASFLVLASERLAVDISERIPAAVKLPDCRYYSVIAPEIRPRLTTISWFTAAHRFGPDKICHRKLTEGLVEFFVDQSLGDVELISCDEITFILGPSEEFSGFPEGIIYNWHPGLPLVPGRAGHPPTDFTAVKLFK